MTAWISAGVHDACVWDDRRLGQETCPQAFIEELCAASGGYGKFFRRLLVQYLGWWAAVILVPTIFMDHHRCESNLPDLVWLLYAAVLVAMVSLAVLLELAVVQRLGLLAAGRISEILSIRRWQVALLSTVMWKLDSYLDVVFMFIARDCGSSLWLASFATFMFAVVFGQLLLNTFFAFTDCDHQLPSSFGFMLLDFKLVNTAVQGILPFDPDFSHLPVQRPVTLRITRRFTGIEKLVSDIAQVSIQIAFLRANQPTPNFVKVSVLSGLAHGIFSLYIIIRGYVQDELAVQGTPLSTALLPCESIRGFESRIAERTKVKQESMKRAFDQGSHVSINLPDLL